MFGSSAIRAGLLAAALTMAAAGSCSPADTPKFGTDAAPADRVRLATTAVGDSDPAATRRLVEQLDSDDPAVRLVAITALERRTGTTLGYRHDAGAPEREAAVQRWVRYIAESPVPAQGGGSS